MHPNTTDQNTNTASGIIPDEQHYQYRVLANTDPDSNEPYFTINIVAHANGRLLYYHGKAPAIHGQSVKELEHTLQKMTAALSKPILWAGSRFPEEYKEA